MKKITVLLAVCFLSIIIIPKISPVYGYVLNTNTKKIHADGCKEIAKIKPEHHQYSNSNSVPGYVACKKCNAREAGKPAVQPGTMAGTTNTQSKQNIRVKSVTSARDIPVIVNKSIKPENFSDAIVLKWGTVKVERVIDGDTLLLEGGVRVRLTGADTAETVKPNTPIQPFGKEAFEFTQRMVKMSGGKVYLEKDGDEIDKYGRQLAMVYFIWKEEGQLDKFRCLNTELIWEGLARAQTQYRYSQKMKDVFIKAEKDAQRDKIGIWSLAQ